MRQLIASIAMALLVLTVAPDPARADPTAEAKAGTGIEKRELTGAGTSFKKGETVYVWSSVDGASGKTVEHVWKRDGKEVRKASFPIKAGHWRVNSKYTSAQAGSYVVEVIAEAKKIAEVAFKVE
jgi:hypothetical protein